MPNEKPKGNEKDTTKEKDKKAPALTLSDIMEAPFHNGHYISLYAKNTPRKT